MQCICVYTVRVSALWKYHSRLACVLFILAHRIESIDIESAIHFAIQAFQNKESIELPVIEEPIIANDVSWNSYFDGFKLLI